MLFLVKFTALRLSCVHFACMILMNFEILESKKDILDVIYMLFYAQKMVGWDARNGNPFEIIVFVS